MAAKRVAIVQSNYIPWKGYFDLVASVDELVLYDDVQYTRRDWRNRNRIKTAHGLRWLTIPVATRGRYEQRIDETEVSDPDWASGHWSTIKHSYARAPCFEAFGQTLEDLYLGTEDALLSRINERFLRAICGLLGIDTPITRSEGHAASAGRTGRLVALCQRAGATQYVSGPAAKDYLEEEQFADAGIAVSYFDYAGYPEYPQLYPPFEHRVSIVDLLLHTGAKAPRFMKCVPRREAHRR
jgi:hypothetical protein